MNINKLSILLILSLFILTSCSSDDDGVEDNNNGNENPDTETEIEENFFPLTVGNNWDFENILTSPNQDDVVSVENLSVSGIVDINGSTGYEMETDNPSGSGPVTLALSQGTLLKENSSLAYTGVLGLGLNGFPDVNFDVENASIYDTSLSNETEMFSQSGSIEQDFQDFPITINYTLSTVMGDSFNDFEVNGVTYDNVISSQLIINVEATTILQIPILESQNAVVITNYFADQVGLIQSETDTNFVFEEISIPNFPLQDISFNTLQLLTDYDVVIE